VELNEQISSHHEAVLKVICYYDVFNHPLTPNEIEKNISIEISSYFLYMALSDLVDMGLLSSFNDYYFLHTKQKSIVASRLEKEKRAKEFMRKSTFFTRIISSFPFVEAVCISGSLSKGVMEPDGDIDYFIITTPQRLWLCRSFLILFKKLFLFNSHKYFCVNYFVDTNNLIIPDENLFTATEVSSLLPVINHKLYQKFMSANSWVQNYFPNTSLRNADNCIVQKKNLLKRFAEFVLGGSLGEYIDNLFFKLTLKRWKKKFPHFTSTDFNLNLRTRKTVSKHHPRGYQQKVLQRYNEQLITICENYKTKTVKVA
jgi:hypothetical protein